MEVSLKTIQVQDFGDPENMELVDFTIPGPGKGEILIQVEAIGVNPVDTYIRAGTYPLLPKLPFTPGKDVSGTISALGDEVTGWHVGDRVYSSGTRSGGYAEYAICGEEQVFPLPENMSFQEGAAVGVPGAAAWRALFVRGEGTSGDRVLIHGASGSVGLAAIQLAKAVGMEVHGTAGTGRGLEVIRELGVDHYYDHRNAYYCEEIEDNCGEGFHLILEMLANVNLEHDLGFLAPRGRVVIIGSRGRIEIDPRATMGKETEIRGMSLFNCSAEEMTTAQSGLYDAMETGKYKPVISQTMVLAKASFAHRQVLEPGNCGKILLLP